MKDLDRNKICKKIFLPRKKQTFLLQICIQALHNAIKKGVGILQFL